MKPKMYCLSAFLHEQLAFSAVLVKQSMNYPVLKGKLSVEKNATLVLLSTPPAVNIILPGHPAATGRHKGPPY